MEAITKNGYKFLLAGCGNIAPRHIEQIQKKGVLLAVCDTDKSKLDSYKNMYGIDGFIDFTSMLEACPHADAVTICTPNGLHAEQTIEALSCGFHVLCEKPMSILLSDAIHMMEAARFHNRQLLIVKQNRFNGPVKELKQWIASGQSGKIFSFNMTCLWNRNENYYTSSAWRGTKKMDGGILYTQFSHYIDFLYWLFGEVETIQGISNNINHNGIVEFADQGVVNLRFVSGTIGNVHYSINSYNQNMESSLTVLAENGSIRIGGLSCNKIDYQIGADLTETLDPTQFNQYKDYAGSTSNHQFVYDHFIRGLDTADYDYQSLFEAMKTVEIIERIYAA